MKRPKPTTLKREGIETITPDSLDQLLVEAVQSGFRKAAQSMPSSPPSRTKLSLRIDSPLLKVNLVVAVPSRLMRIIAGSLVVMLGTAMFSG